MKIENTTIKYQKKKSVHSQINNNKVREKNKIIEKWGDGKKYLEFGELGLFESSELEIRL